MEKNELKILPLGGLGEIGMNCLILEWKNSAVLLDCGIQFPDASLPGVELLIPDFSYLIENKKKVIGVVVTHGHEDHIGAIPFLARHFPLKVYSTSFPRGLLKEKLTEHPTVNQIQFEDVVPEKSFTLGEFKFHPIRVQHSIIESLAFAIETPVGTIIHTGDFKHDPNELHGEVITMEAFQEWGKKGVQLLLSDSTNAERAGHTLSENDIANSFESIFQNQQTRLVIALFASNVRRIEKLLRLAKKFGKKVGLAGRSMHTYTKLAFEQGSLDIPESVLVPIDSLKNYEDKEVVVLATGSQAEPQSALLRMALHSYKDFKLKPGDQVIMSSRFIPGNERNITEMIDQLYREGAEVMYESFHQIHVSGHGFQDELIMMLEAVRPKYFIPVHGEYRHLKKHALLAERTGIPDSHICVIENGQSVYLGTNSLERGRNYELKPIPLVEKEVLTSNAEVFTQRLSLAKTGIVFVVLVRDIKSYELIMQPIIKPYGVIYRKDSEEERVTEAASKRLEEIHDKIKFHDDLIDLVRIEVRRVYKKTASHKPYVIPIVIEV